MKTPPMHACKTWRTSSSSTRILAAKTLRRAGEDGREKRVAAKVGESVGAHSELPQKSSAPLHSYFSRKRTVETFPKRFFSLIVDEGNAWKVTRDSSTFLFGEVFPGQLPNADSAFPLSIIYERHFCIFPCGNSLSPLIPICKKTFRLSRLRRGKSSCKQDEEMEEPNVTFPELRKRVASRKSSWQKVPALTPAVAIIR